MHYPRFFFATLTLVICILLDVLVGDMFFSTSRASAVVTTSNANNAAAPLQPEQAPVISPPDFRVPKKKPNALSSNIPYTRLSTEAITRLTSSKPVALPDPQADKNGLLLFSFADAIRYCAKQNKRLPTVLEVAAWASHHGAVLTSFDNVEKRKQYKDEKTIYLQRDTQNTRVDFYFDNDRFVYPIKKLVTNAAVWTQDERSLGGPHNATHYAFSLYGASFSPVPKSSMLPVICVNTALTN